MRWDCAIRPVSPSVPRARGSRTPWRSPTTGTTTRAIAASPTPRERLFIFTEKGQDAGFPDKDGDNFVNIKRSGPDVYRGNKFDPTRPNPQLYIGDKPFVPTLPPYRFIDHSIGVRGTPLIVANPEPERLHQPGAGMGHQQPDGRAGLVDRRPSVRRRTRSSPRCSASSTTVRKACDRCGRRS